MLVVLVFAVAVAGSPLPQQNPPKFGSPPVGDGWTSMSPGNPGPWGVRDIIVLKEPKEGLDSFQPPKAGQSSSPDLPVLPSGTNAPELSSPSTTTSLLEVSDKIEDEDSKDPSTNNERKSRLLFDSNAENQLHTRNASKAKNIDAFEPPSQKLKVTHQVNHVMFEVSEVGPSKSTLPLPTVALDATQPIPVVPPRNSTTAAMAPVFVPKISVDGRPLPKSSNQSDEEEEAPPIPTVQPADNAGTQPVDSPEVVSGYASMTIGPKQQMKPNDVSVSKPNDTLLSYMNDTTPTNDRIGNLPLVQDGLGDTQNGQTSSPSSLSKRKSELKAYLSDLQGIPKESSTQVNPILDLIGYEHDIESLLPKYMIGTKNVSTATFESTVPDETTPFRGLLDSSTISSSTESSTVVEISPNSDIEHDKPFKREAVEKSSNKLRFSDSSSYSDYEKEDANLFSFDPSNRDPRIYVDYSDIEAEKTKHKKISAKIVSSTQSPEEADKKVKKGELLESKQLKKQNETGTYETIVFSDELGKQLQPNIPLVPTSTESIPVNMEESSPVNHVSSTRNVDLTQIEKDDEVIVERENLARPHIASVVKVSVTLGNSSLVEPVKLEESMDSGESSSPGTTAGTSGKAKDAFPEEESSVSESSRDETASEQVIGSEKEDLEVENTEAPVTEDSASQSREAYDRSLILDQTERKSINNEELSPEPARKDSAEGGGSLSTKDPHLDGSHPKVTSEEDDVYAVSPPSAAAVAEAAVLAHFPVDRSKESRALDSRLTADKHVHVHTFEIPSASPSEGESSQTAGGVSAARAASEVNMGYVTAIVCGVLLAVLLVVGLGLFIHSQRRSLNRPKALSCDRGYAGSDSGGYLDDQCQSSYTNSHLDIPKGCSDDVISLDNDSFLNSLESMTIQNLWTDNIKHTKL